MLRIAIFLILLLGTCGYALWRGGAPERIAAGAMLAATVGSALARSEVQHRFVDIEVGLFAIDVLLLIDPVCGGAPGGSRLADAWYVRCIWDGGRARDKAHCSRHDPRNLRRHGDGLELADGDRSGDRHLAPLPPAEVSGL
jgi:hypothetical protein